MASFDELYDEVTLVNSLSMFESTDDMDDDDVLTFREVERIDKTIDAGKVAAAIALFSAATLPIIAKMKKKATTRSIENQVSNLEKAITQIKSLQNSGNLSPREAKKQIRKITKELKALVKDIEKGRSVKESVDSDDLRLEIYESCYYGDITEEERDILLDLL